MATKKTIDSTKAKAEPSTTSRPIIVSHGPQVQDPMMKPEEVSEEAVAPTPSAAKKVIQPLESTEKPEDTSTPEEKPTEESSDAAKEEAKEAAVVDAVAEQADLDKKKAAGPTEEDLKKQEEIEKLITSKKYAVPIGQVAKRRNKRASVVVLVLILLLAGAYLVVDANIVETEIQLPFELIKN